MKIQDHPLGNKFPRASERPTILLSPDEFNPLVRCSNCPTKLDDWIYSDLPQISIHAVSFQDATIITVTWIHTLTDVMGISEFLYAWTSVLRGEKEAVLGMQGFQSNLLSLVGRGRSGKEYIHYDRLLSRKGLLCFAGMNIFERLWHRREERRTICLPAASLKHLCSKANADISASDTTRETKAVFVSESDVLLAWWVSTLHYALGLRPGQNILVNNALNLRTSPHQIFESTLGVYMGNALCMSPTFITGREIAAQPLGQTALRIRQSLAQQRTAEQIEAVTALQMEMIAKTGYLALVGDPRMVLLSCSNWHKARLYELDFSAAVMPRAADSNFNEQSVKGKPSYVNGVQHSPNSFRNVLSVIGKDSGGNWWLTGVLRMDAWTKVQLQLDIIDTP